MSQLLREQEYLRLPSRSNVYGITPIACQTPTPGLLVTNQVSDDSTDAKIFHISLEAHPSPSPSSSSPSPSPSSPSPSPSPSLVNPPTAANGAPQAAQSAVSSSAVPFTYIPVEAEVISVDSYDRKAKDCKLSPIVGITIAKPIAPASKSSTYYLNIYGGTTSGPLDMMQLSGDCQSIPISYTPFLLTHASVKTESGSRENMFLLCGGDNRVHLFEEDVGSGFFQEQPVGKYFPELEKVQNKVLCLSVYENDQNRVVAVGCQDGTLHLGIGSKTQEDDGRIHKVAFDGPVTSVGLFRSSTREKPSELNPLHLLVSGSLDYACVYGSVETQGLSSPVVLPQSESHDSVLCSLVRDLNFDGMNEIILGTYGQMILVYQGKPSSGYELVWKRSFAYPICSLLGVDLTKDGVEEVVVLSMFGVHIMQGSIRLAHERLRSLLGLNVNGEVAKE